MAFMPPLAPIVVLLFLGSIAATMLAAAVFVYGAVRGIPAVRKWGGIAALAIPASYGALLVLDGLGSQDRVLTPGGKKYFCEIDCHLAYSVERVERKKILGGTLTVVTLKTWFDESTTSPMRPKEAPLYPNPRQVYVADASGRRFTENKAGERALEETGVESAPLSRPLVPGQSYLTRLVFDLPGNVRDPRLFVGDADPVSSFLLFHEQGPLHRKIWFAL
jgi:hypothetical protein